MSQFNLPTAETIQFEVQEEPIPLIRITADGLLLGLLRKVSGDLVFTSDEIGSLTLPPTTHTDDLPGLIAAFYAENEEKWHAANTQSDLEDEDYSDEEE